MRGKKQESLSFFSWPGSKCFMALYQSTAHGFGTTGLIYEVAWTFLLSRTKGQRLNQTYLTGQSVYFFRSVLTSSGGVILLFLSWCVTGGGDRGLSAVPRVRARVPDLQRNPQHAAEWRWGVDDSVSVLLLHAEGLWVFRERKERLDSGLTWCHEEMGFTVWLIVVLSGWFCQWRENIWTITNGNVPQE